ncbi:MAG: PP2C family protein-serine/threonine phosphatase, partial [Phycisphaerae bacterium]
EAISGKVVYVEDSRTDPRVRYPAQARKEGIVSALVAGMIYRGRPVGVMRIYTGQRYRFSAFERSLLQALASQAAAAIVNAQLHAEALEAERYQRQIQYAGQVQRRMIPARAPAHHRLQIGCVYDPMMELGGDFYDFLELGQGDLGLVIADVVGKGVAASLMMASVRSALRTAAQEIYDLDKVMARANRQLCHDTLISEFATVFYGVINPDATRLTYCNAGHDPPLLLRDGQFQSLETGGMVIGVRPDERYEKGVVHLRPGDLLVLYTDGLVEATNFQHQWFGRQNLRRSILRYRQLDAQELAQQLLWDVRRFVGLADRIDDITLVAVKVCG